METHHFKFRLTLTLAFVLYPLSLMAVTGPDHLSSEPGHEEQPLDSAFKEDNRRPFLDDQQWKVNWRTYYLNRDTDQESDRETLATGGSVNWTSGYFQKYIQVGMTVYTSQKVFGDKDKDGAGLLQDEQQSYGGVGELYIDGVLGDTHFRGGRFAINTPYMNKHDIRMLPNTFQGARVTHQLTKNWLIGGGHITHMKDRTSTGFDKLYEREGFDDDKGVTAVGSIYTRGAQTGGFYYYHAPDFMDTLYFEYDYKQVLNKDDFLSFGAQYTHQNSVGEKFDSEFDIDHFGGKAKWKTGSLTTDLTYTYYSDTEQIRNPWGGVPGYTSVIVKDFYRPGESTWMLGFDYDFSDAGIPGLSANTNFLSGDTPDNGINASPDQDEWDLTVDYRLQQGVLKNFWIRLRHAHINQKNSNGNTDAKDMNDARLILNYEVPL